MLKQTYPIKVGDVIGTAFSVDYGGERYRVTARHLLTGLPVKHALILLWQKGEWKETPTKRTLFVSPPNVDIAVLETYVFARAGITTGDNSKSLEGEQITVADNSKPSIGQQVWYFGYPNTSTVPAIKLGKISGIDVSTPDAFILHIDGPNDPSFFGGPILFWDPNNHAFRILGVIQRHENDSVPPQSKGREADRNSSVSDGVLTRYSVEYAMRAIKRPRE
jgi:hypothetical protein